MDAGTWHGRRDALHRSNGTGVRGGDSIASLRGLRGGPEPPFTHRAEKFCRYRSRDDRVNSAVRAYRSLLLIRPVPNGNGWECPDAAVATGLVSSEHRLPILECCLCCVFNVHGLVRSDEMNYVARTAARTSPAFSASPRCARSWRRTLAEPLVARIANQSERCSRLL